MMMVIVTINKMPNHRKRVHEFTTLQDVFTLMVTAKISMWLTEVMNNQEFKKVGNVTCDSLSTFNDEEVQKLVFFL